MAQEKVDKKRELLDGSRSGRSPVPRTISVDPPIYEELLTRDPRWALSEGSRHFEEDSAVFKALRNIVQLFTSSGFCYAVVGGMALFRHGLRRYTEDVNIIVTKDDLKEIHEKLEGLHCLPLFKHRPSHEE